MVNPLKLTSKEQSPNLKEESMNAPRKRKFWFTLQKWNKNKKVSLVKRGKERVSVYNYSRLLQWVKIYLSNNSHS